MEKRLLLSFVLMVTLVLQVAAQNRTITGQVTDRSNGTGLPGVTVLLKGTTTGTATGADGSYTISVPAEGGTLVFSSVGYNNLEQPIGTTNQVSVGLAPSTQQLGEVVVTALGIQREKRALGYAVSEISSSQVVQKAEPDVLRTLQGKLPGVNIGGSSGSPGAATRITIRGNSSLLGENQPLFVVDGIPFDNRQDNSASSLGNSSSYSNRAADIDPNNIESINVLKGIAAAALYGSRAANGAIVITTKTGSRNRRDKGLRVGYNSTYAVERIASLPDYQNRYGSGANFAYSAANGSWGPAFGSPQAPADVAHPYDTPALNGPLPQFRGARYPYQAFDDNVKDFFNTGHLFENSVNLTGVGENSKFTAVLSRSDQEGMIPFTSFDRTSISAGGSGQFNKITVGATVTYVNSDQRGPILGAPNALGNASAFGRALFLPRNLDLSGLPFENPVTRASLLGWLTGQADNPYWSTRYNSYKSRVDRVIGNFNASYDFTDWLSLSFTGGANVYTDRRNTALRPGSVAAGGLGQVVQDYITNTELEGTTLLTFNRNLTEDISIRAIVGHNVNQRSYENSSVVGSTYTVFNIDDITNTRSVAQNGTLNQKRRLFGVLGDVTLGFRDFIYINATGRNDWTSTLARNNRSFFYPSISGSVIFTEAFGIKSDVLNLGKLRLSYAKAGNDAAPYQILTRFSLSPGLGNNAASLGFPFTPTGGVATSGAAVFGTVGNLDLTPEFTKEVEGGVDLNFLKDRIVLSATYYDRRTTSQIANVTLPFATGFTAFTTNFGEVSNKGVEVGLTLIPVDVAGFRWTSFTAFTRNRNIVEELREGLQQQLNGTTGAFFSDPQSVHRPGQPFGLLVGSVAARDPESGRVLIDRNTGRPIVSTTPDVIGNPNPDFQFGFTNTFTYKGITLEGVIDYRQGGDIYSTTIQTLYGRGVTKDTEDRNKTVVVDGIYGDPNTRQPLRAADGSTIPNATAISLNDLYFGTGSFGIGGPSEFSVYDGTTIRLREVTLGYEVPTKLLDKTKFIRGVNIGFSARNLFWYSPNIPEHMNFDPETSTYGNANAQGFDFSNAPTARRYGVNLRVNF
ncbi:SusC/RagA family TonB-linked outer membrane protein [Hymenobacter latericus]|uniref:SusC/RagA family TonB-linked outer membrane protein n=1 Tax=Hymenobacter sp. YIM 151858-1 TaxID=2987688 RepID=UPI002225DE89|nr:SusC/RagA family TonB-linked outer membrane protein [Hymenobacter sp. YIM 151858-1]UYZ59223.1 SusC/RagA family TonB-linked outer membrane protein [Hymenobacter sp. YIM 151858-1]